MRRKREVTAPAPPAHLDAEAAAEWVRIVAELAALDIRGGIDRPLLEGYCCAYSRWREAETKLREMGGAVVRGPTGGAQQSPWLQVARAALRDMRQCLNDLGLTPAKRTKAKKKDGDGAPGLSILDVG
jgi:P27 family predicted phage terminase small subunit